MNTVELISNYGNSDVGGKVMSPTSAEIGYIDVGDGCRRPNVLVTDSGCW